MEPEPTEGVPVEHGADGDTTDPAPESDGAGPEEVPAEAGDGNDGNDAAGDAGDAADAANDESDGGGADPDPPAAAPAEDGAAGQGEAGPASGEADGDEAEREAEEVTPEDAPAAAQDAPAPTADDDGAANDDSGDGDAAESEPGPSPPTTAAADEGDTEGALESATAVSESGSGDGGYGGEVTDGVAAKVRDVPTTPLNFNWVLGFDCRLPSGVHYLADNEREEIFYPAGHLGLLFSHIDHEQALLQGHRNAIVATASSADKRWLATADRGRDEVTIVWDTVSGDPVRTWFDDELESVGHLAFSSDGTLLAALSGERQCTLTVWEWSAGASEPLCECRLDAALGATRHVAFHPDSNRQLIVTRDSEVNLVRWTVGEGAATVPLRVKGVSTSTLGQFELSVFFPGTTQVATVTAGGFVVRWETDGAGECLKYIKIFGAPITCACMTPDGQTLVAGGRCGTVKYFDTAVRLVGWNDELAAGPITSISFTAASDEIGPGRRRRSSITALGVEGSEVVIPNYVVGTSHGRIVLVTADRSVSSATQILATHAAEVRALAAHPTLPYLAIAGFSGLLQVWDYSVREDVVSAVLPAGIHVTAMAYSPAGDILVVGSAAGDVSIVDSISLTEYTAASRFSALTDAVTHVCFSADGTMFAAASADRYVALFRAEGGGAAGGPSESVGAGGGADDAAAGDEESEWRLVGKHRSHARRIRDLQFGVDRTGATRLLSVGEDRMLVEYDLAGSSFTEGLLLKGQRTQIEQTAAPLALCWHPRTDSEEFLMVANSDLKVRLYNAKTKQCRRTALGPHHHVPVDRLVVPAAYPKPDSPRVAAFSAGDSVGLVLLPFDGNPHRVTSVVGHASGVSALVASNDGRYVFTAGGHSVHMWSAHEHVLTASAALGGEGVEPFVGLLEGGRDGEQFKDMEDFFYYVQLETQGLNTMGRREVSDRLALGQVPRVFRALGYYPSEQEVANMVNEVKFSQYLETKTHVTDVDIDTLVRLFVNHRPAPGKGLSLDHVEAAFDALSGDGSGKMSIESLVEVLETAGEHFSEDELAKALGALLRGRPLKDVLSPAATAASFSEGVLGF